MKFRAFQIRPIPPMANLDTARAAVLARLHVQWYFLDCAEADDLPDEARAILAAARECVVDAVTAQGVPGAVA